MPENIVPREEPKTGVHPTDAILEARVLSLKLKSWNDFHLAYHRFLPGELDIPAMTGHVVAIHLGSPVKMAERRAGHAYSGVYFKGDVEIIPAGCAGWWEFETTDEGISIALEHSFIQQAAAESVEINPDHVELISNFRTRDPLIEQIGLAFFSELSDEAEGGRLFIDSAANMLSVHLLRKYSTCSPTIRNYRDGLSKPKLSRAIEFINENLKKDLSLSEIAEVVGISSFYFAKLFKQSTSLTPHQYVIERRIERAKELLANTDLQVADIAYEVGFANQSHMARNFRKLTSTTPTKFRKHN